jgi:hypothetical protein
MQGSEAESELKNTSQMQEIQLQLDAAGRILFAGKWLWVVSN